MTQNRAQDAIARDGRFLINQPVPDAAAPISLILNWNLTRRSSLRWLGFEETASEA